MIRFSAATVLMASAPAMALEITTIFEGTIDGTLDGDAFTNQAFVLTVNGDTDNLIPYDFGPDTIGFDLPVDTATISLPGLNGGTTLNVTSTTFLTVGNGNSTMGFTDENFFSGAFLIDSTFDTYDLASPIGPITSGGITNDFPVFETDGGDFVFGSDTPTLTFTVTLVPEPASLALLGLGWLTVIRRRRI